MKIRQLIVCLLFLVLIAPAISAQEFRIRVAYTVDGAVWNNPVYFGYDPAASDGLEYHKWPSSEYPNGEEQVPDNSFGDIDIRMSGAAINRIDSLGTGSYIDIRHKPDSAAFQLQYEIDLIANTATTASLSWDTTNIPAIIHHIYLQSTESRNIRLDMKQTNHFDIPLDSFRLGLYNYIILTLLYNTDNDNSGVVAEQAASGGALIFPNVISAYSKARLAANSTHPLNVTYYDVTGRMISEESVAPSFGSMELTHLPAVPGIYIAEIRDRELGTEIARQKIIIR